MVFVFAWLISNGATNVYYDEQIMGEWIPQVPWHPKFKLIGLDFLFNLFTTINTFIIFVCFVVQDKWNHHPHDPRQEVLWTRDFCEIWKQNYIVITW
jgi:hypothetical protein